MQPLLAVALIIFSSGAYAGGYGAGGIADGLNGTSDYQRAIERRFEADDLDRLIRRNNQLLEDQRRQQDNRDMDRILQRKNK